MHNKDEAKELDDMIEQIAVMVEKDESRTAVANPVRYMQLQFANKVLKYLAGGTDYVVECVANSPFKSMGSTSIEGKELSFCNSEWFCRAAEFADNMEVLALTNGRVKITFTFHGITVPIE